MEPVLVRSVGLTGLAAWATVVWSAAGTMFYLLMPKSAPIILLLGMLAPLLWLGSAVRYLRPFRASGLSLMLAISVREALREAVAAFGEGEGEIALASPATGEAIFTAVQRRRS